MGSMRDLLGMIPGMDRQLKGVDIDEGAFKRVEGMIQSMTLKERQRPEIINGSRRRRIATGSGVKVQDVNRLIRQFDQMRRTMKKMTRGNTKDLMKGLGVGGGMPEIRGRR
jgi:signal recognition particle subunit SRP54